jgi:DNA-binding transcriptional MerR regulator
MERMSIGVLARRAGVTVRTLHYYDARKLLTPSVRTSSGARRYGERDLSRLHHILVLRQWGYSLAEIRLTLDDRSVDAVATIRRQISVFQEQARQATERTERLQHIVDILSKGRAPKHTAWLELLEMAALYQQHLTTDEVSSLRHPKDGNASDLELQWRQLVIEMNAAISRRTPSSSTQARALAWRWLKLVIARTSNNATLWIKLRALQSSNARAQQIDGVGTRTLAWIGVAVAHARTARFAKYLSASQTRRLRRRQLASLQSLDAWQKLVAQVREQMETGVPTDAPGMQALAGRWDALFREFHFGDDSAMEARVRVAFASEPDLHLGIGVSPALIKYIRAAIERLPQTRHPNREAATVKTKTRVFSAQPKAFHWESTASPDKGGTWTRK